MFTRLKTQYEHADLYQIDVDENQEVTQSCFRGEKSISLPTFKLYKGGKWLASVQQPYELTALVSQHATPPTILLANETVSIFGLKSRPELNSQPGTIKRFDGAKGRYAVSINGETVSLRRDNLCLKCTVALEVSPDGSEGALPEAVAGSSEGVVSGYDADAHAYMVTVPNADLDDLTDPEPIAVPAACCRVPVGATGLLLGLVGGAQYNGSQVRVQGIDAATGRYEVELGGQFSGKHLKVKRANLRV